MNNIFGFVGHKGVQSSSDARDNCLIVYPPTKC